jgi:hypothetical protein
MASIKWNMTPTPKPTPGFLLFTASSLLIRQHIWHNRLCMEEFLHLQLEKARCCGQRAHSPYNYRSRGLAAVKRHGWGKRKRLDTSLVLLIVPYRVCPIKPHSNYYKGTEYSGRARALQLSLPHSSAFYSLHYISAHVFIQNRQKNVESPPSFSLSRHEGQFCDTRRGVVRGGGFQKVVYVNGTQNLKTSSSNPCTSLSPLNQQAPNHSRITQYLHIYSATSFGLVICHHDQDTRLVMYIITDNSVLQNCVSLMVVYSWVETRHR